MPTNLTRTSSDPSSSSAKFNLIVTSNKSNEDSSIIYPSASNNYCITQAIIPQGSTFRVGAHWHEDYDEFLRVAKGRARIRLGNTWKVYTADDGEILVKKGVVHDIMRADAVGGPQDEGDVVIEETGDPVDGSKELFFRHIFSVSNIDHARFGWKLPLQVFLLLSYTDGYLEIVPKTVGGQYFTYGLHWFVKKVARWVGLSPFYDEYTPERLSGIRKKLEAGGGRKMN